ncbi:phage baseplate plug family protein [Zymobacter palmae]|uniref:Uncharacterized membrane-anchored protein n=1 Tax=Zymobacter palmae TaxID=33074 RepID=A0A348HFG4_9GAMM|nr:hypothetical protein [Zymobacter palmae]BBG30366.1 uncharacterized membrane-anchored protein [Zymobacter palmae]
MNVQIIPLQQAPSQQFSINLNNQSCTIKVHQRDGHVYVDLYVNGEAVVLGALARDRVGLTRHAYLTFNGELLFVDTRERDDPRYTDFSARWSLLYLYDS